MKLTPALFISLMLNWATGSLRRIERRTTREIQEYQPEDVSAIESSPHNNGATNGDVGILERSRLLAKTARCKRKDTVDCAGGVNRDNITQTCAEACQDEYGVGGCCVGANACDGFTGLVCRDADASTGFMGSCSGTDACRNANIGSVFQSCAEGYKSCEGAGQNGYIGSMKGSCLGPRACTGAAANQGYISLFEGSCHGPAVCQNVAANGGAVGEVENSCFGQQSCYNLAADQGVVGAVVDSCSTIAPFGPVPTQTCKNAARNGVITLGILSSCNETRSCYAAASGGAAYYDPPAVPGLSQGYIYFIASGCNDDKTREKLAYVDPNTQGARSLAKVKTLGVGDDITCINGCCDNNTEVCAELALEDVTTVQDTCGPCKKNFFN